MGQQSEFICPQCDYTAVVAGGFDCGFEVAYMTIVCLDCRALYDALADEKPHELLQDIDRNEPDKDGESELDVSPTGLACPKDARHAIALWEFPGGCPKCGAQMGRGRPCPCWD